jgi:hypothetical protein
MDEEIADQQRLRAAQLTQKSRLLALQRSRAELKGRLGEVNTAMAERRAQIAELNMAIVRIGTEYRACHERTGRNPDDAARTDRTAGPCE